VYRCFSTWSSRFLDCKIKLCYRQRSLRLVIDTQRSSVRTHERDALTLSRFHALTLSRSHALRRFSPRDSNQKSLCFLGCYRSLRSEDSRQREARRTDFAVREQAGNWGLDWTGLDWTWKITVKIKALICPLVLGGTTGMKNCWNTVWCWTVGRRTGPRIFAINLSSNW